MEFQSYRNLLKSFSSSKLSAEKLMRFDATTTWLAYVSKLFSLAKSVQK